MHDRCVDIRDVMAVFDCVKAQFIRGAVDQAMFETGACHPDRETVWMMIASTLGAFHTGRAAELRSPDDNRVFEETSLLEVLQFNSPAIGLSTCAQRREWFFCNSECTSHSEAWPPP